MSKRTLTTLLLIILCVGLMVGSGAVLLFPQNASQENETEEKLEFTEEAVRQFRILMEDTKTWTPTEQKLSPQIVYKLKKDRGDPIFDHLPEFRADLEVAEDGTVKVAIYGDITEDLAAKVVASGGSLVVFMPGYSHMVCRVPLNKIEKLAELPEIRRIMQNDPGRVGYHPKVKKPTKEGENRD